MCLDNLGIMFKRKSRSCGPRSIIPDWYIPIFEDYSLPDYDPSAYKCRTTFADPPNPSSSSQSSAIKTGERRRGYDQEDYKFYNEQKKQEFPPSAYSDAFLQHTTQNPRRWYEIGIAFDKGHAAIIIHDLTGTDTDKPDLQFEYIGIKEKSARTLDGGGVQRLHLVNRTPSGELVPHELLFQTLKVPSTFGSYYSVCRLRTTERTIKYNGALSFPMYYKMVASDCATFAHNFLIKTLTGVHNEGSIAEPAFDSIVNNLVEHNHIKDGRLGDTEAVSRDNEALGYSGGTVAESSV